MPLRTASVPPSPPPSPPPPPEDIQDVHRHLLTPHPSFALLRCPITAPLLCVAIADIDSAMDLVLK